MDNDGRRRRVYPLDRYLEGYVALDSVEPFYT